MWRQSCDINYEVAIDHDRSRHLRQRIHAFPEKRLLKWRFWLGPLFRDLLLFTKCSSRIQIPYLFSMTDICRTT
jgi:hypothetical protein